MWTRTKEPVRKLHNLHVFGCPVYVLQKEIADGKKIPRWRNRSTRGMHMGVSEKHSGDAPLVLNPKTGKITPQWNVIFDDWFSTITIEEDNLPDFHSEEWAETFGMHTCMRFQMKMKMLRILNLYANYDGKRGQLTMIKTDTSTEHKMSKKF